MNPNLKRYILDVIQEDKEFREELQSFLLNDASYDIRSIEKNIFKLALIKTNGSIKDLMKLVGYSKYSYDSMKNKAYSFGLKIKDFIK